MKGELVFCIRAPLVPCNSLRQQLRSTRWRATPSMTRTGCKLFTRPGSVSEGVPETRWSLPRLLYCVSSCSTVKCRGIRPVIGDSFWADLMEFGRTAKGQRAVSPAIPSVVPDTEAFLYNGRRSLHSVAANLHRHNISPSGVMLDSTSTASSAASPVAGELGSPGAPSTPVDPMCLADPRKDFPVAENSNAPSTASATLDTVIGPVELSKGSYAKELFQHIQDSAKDAATLEDAGGATASSQWFVDWLLALKLGLDVPWCLAFPAAGCILRLITLPIAIDSERDRRQRQLVDPQFSRMKEKMKVAHETGNTAEFQRLRAETKLFLKKHGVGVLPVSFFQMGLLGLTISFSTPAIRGMARSPEKWRGFAVEQPGWVESLALPDPDGITSVLCWLVLVSTMAAGWMVSAKIQKRSPSVRAATGTSSPVVTRGASLVAATIFAVYSGMQLPAAAILFLVPAFAMQNAFMRIFRSPLVERGLHFVPEGLRPLQQTYITLLERREPALVATWKRHSANAQSGDSVAEATAAGAAATSRAIVQLWKQTVQADLAAPQYFKTWAQQVAGKQQKRLSNAA